MPTFLGLPVLNGLELIQKIKNIAPPPDSILVSFDVVGLFINIPLNSTIEYITDQLQQTQVPENVMNDFISLLEICTRTNICSFDHTDSQMVLGSPLNLYLDQQSRSFS